jgi:outer membrane protein assembly factor BamB
MSVAEGLQGTQLFFSPVVWVEYLQIISSRICSDILPHMKFRVRQFWWAQLTLVALSFPASAEDWTRFRGPNGSGVSKDKGFPVEFGKGKNAMWRTPVRAGKSSPVLTERYIFLTGFEKEKLFTQCFDRKTGKLAWERAANRIYRQEGNRLNNPAAITPVTDGENVYVFFKDFGLISYDPAGNVRWKVPLGPFTNTVGLAASPIVAGDSIVLVADQLRGSYIAAFDRRNGETRWKTAREESEGWATPLLYDAPCSAPLILTAGQGRFGAHRLVDGKRIFSQPGLSPAIVASPVLGENTIFAFGYGGDSGDTASPFQQYLAQFDKNHDGQISPDEYRNVPDDPDHLMRDVLTAAGNFMGNGDGIVTKEKLDAWWRHTVGPSRLLATRLDCEPGAGQETPVRPRELWQYDKSFVGVIPSPLLYDGVLYLIKNGGILTALDAATGRVLKVDRVKGALGEYAASPVAADGKVFLVNEEGKVAVLRAGRDWDVVAVNDLGEGSFATPALSQGRIYLRTDETLYCFGSTGSR